MFKISKKTIISGAIGNALEMYDYVIWGLFSTFLAKEYLPPHSSLSDIFYLFLITYALRPIGSLICGLLSDQLGRKKILTISILLMGACTSLVGILPSYITIGVLSVFLLIIIRFIQVFTVGGEYISSISLLIESCDKNQRGYFGSWAAFGVNAGMLLASSIGAVIIHLMDIHLIPKWGWRLAFIISFITMLVGFWIRNSIPESFEFLTENARNEKKPIIEIICESILTIKLKALESFVVFILVLFGVSTTILIFIYAPIHMTTINNLKNVQSFAINASSLALLTILIPVFGIISDKVGRIKTIYFGITLLLLAIMPYFVLISSGTFLQVLLIHMFIGIPCACVFSLTPVLITEIFPLSVRCSIAGLLYSLAACLGGGVTPLLAFKLANNLHGDYYLSFIILISGCISLIALGILNKKNKKNVMRLRLVPTMKRI